MRCGRPRLQIRQDADTVMVLAGDTPLLTGATLSSLIAEHRPVGRGSHGAHRLDARPTGYGRIVRDDRGVRSIVEHRDATTNNSRSMRSTVGCTCSPQTPCAMVCRTSEATTRRARSI